MKFSMGIHSLQVVLLKMVQSPAQGRRRKPAERQDRGTMGDGNSSLRTTYSSLAPFPSIGSINLTGEASYSEWENPPPGPTGYRIPRLPPKNHIKGSKARANGQSLSSDLKKPFFRGLIDRPRISRFANGEALSHGIDFTYF